jgi:hypothetical protein
VDIGGVAATQSAPGIFAFSFGGVTGCFAFCSSSDSRLCSRKPLTTVLLTWSLSRMLVGQALGLLQADCHR